MSASISAASELRTVRDLLRFAVSGFTAAHLTLRSRHELRPGRSRIPHPRGLNLPIDDINPWLDARLTLAEREKLIGLFDSRIETRKPAPYIVGKA